MSDFETTYKDLLSKKHRNEKGQYATGGRKETRLEADEARELWDAAFEAGRVEVIARVEGYLQELHERDAPELPVVIHLVRLLQGVEEDTSSLEQGEVDEAL